MEGQQRNNKTVVVKLQVDHKNYSSFWSDFITTSALLLLSLLISFILFGKRG